MTRLIWHAHGSRLYEFGIDRGVFYPQQGEPVVWDGVIAVNETSSEDSVSLYVDGKPYRKRKSEDSFTATLEAFTYPLEFEEYDGSASGSMNPKVRKSFGLSYRTRIGNDGKYGSDYAYRIHLLYNVLAAPSESSYSSIGNSSDITVFSWGLTTLPTNIPGFRAGAHLIIDTTIAYSWVVEELEGILYGTDDTPPRLPSISELIELFENASILLIIDHGDGIWTAIGPDSAIQMLDETTFQITWPSAIYLDEESYQISSL